MRHRFAFIALALCSAACSDNDSVTRPEVAPKDATRSTASQLLRDVRVQFRLDASSEGLARPVSDSLSARMGERILDVRAAGRGPQRLTLTLPARADEPSRVQDLETGTAISFKLAGASEEASWVPAEGVLVAARALPKADVVLRVREDGLEDFVRIDAPPKGNELRYEVGLEGVAGLRQIANVLEVLDATGTPRLRVRAPAAIDARANKHALRLAVRGCEVDRDPRGPWGRAVLPPGSDTCELAVRWDGDVHYPLLVDPAWTATANMSFARTAHGAGLLPSGRVLVAGGYYPEPGLTSEIWDPATGTWAMTGMLNVRREASWELPRLKNDKLLLAGSQHVALAGELYDEGTGSWTSTKPLVHPRGHTIPIVLNDGRALLTSGFFPWDNPNAEAYDPDTDTWSLAGTMSQGRYHNAIVKLADGRVIAAGGWTGQGEWATATVEIFDPATNTWSSAAPMHHARAEAPGILLPSGKVLVVGGRDTTKIPPILTSVESYDPATNTWTLEPPVKVQRTMHRLARLDDGRVLALGGWQSGPTTASVEMWLPTGGWEDTASMVWGRDNHTATRLTDGRWLVAGGGNILNTAEVYGLVQNGGTCSRDNECVSLHCADGYCCDTACTGPCVACSAAKKGTGANGTCGAIATATDPDAECSACSACSGSGACAPVAAGSDPKNNCKDSGSPTCGLDGACDGQGACRSYPVNVNCVPMPCTAGSQCLSGQCRDGICCDTSCGGECMACTAAKKGSGVDGVCGAIAADSDPDEECEEGINFPTSCLEDGMCDGQGKCRPFAKDTQSCGVTQCNGNAAVGLLCNGAGTCGQAVAYCDPYLCKEGACLAACQTNNDCTPDAFCTSTGACQKKLTLGSPCTVGYECVTNFCVDGVCCDSACSGQCEACNVQPNVGSCSPVLGDPAGARPACAGMDQDCSGACDGVDRSSCRYPSTVSSCSTPSCTAGIARSFHCDGQGQCVPGTDQPCGAYACGETACKASCEGPEDCAQGYGCATEGTCVPGGASKNGAICTVGAECESGFCADGVCCDTACNGQCEACNVEPNLGACVPVNGSPVGGRTPCVTTDADCAGACDGVDRGACSYPGSDISCGETSCEGGIARASFCNAKGACVAADDKPCGAYGCGESKCKTVCSSVEDCAPGYTCTEQGMCVPGSTCTEDLVRSIGVSGERSCAPFLCDPASGSCRQLCSASNECVSGYVCDTAIKACVTASQNQVVEEDEGCGCRVPGATPKGSALALAIGAGLLALTRRKRRESLV